MYDRLELKTEPFSSMNAPASSGADSSGSSQPNSHMNMDASEPAKPHRKYARYHNSKYAFIDFQWWISVLVESFLAVEGEEEDRWLPKCPQMNEEWLFWKETRLPLLDIANARRRSMMRWLDEFMDWNRIRWAFKDLLKMAKSLGLLPDPERRLQARNRTIDRVVEGSWCKVHLQGGGRIAWCWIGGG